MFSFIAFVGDGLGVDWRKGEGLMGDDGDSGLRNGDALFGDPYDSKEGLYEDDIA